MQNGFFARFCIDRMGIAVQSLRDNPPGMQTSILLELVTLPLCQSSHEHRMLFLEEQTYL